MSSLHAPIAAVTVYRSGALVARSSVIADAGACPEEVVIDDLPLSLEDRSLRARIEGGEGLVAIDVALSVALAAVDPSLPPAESEALRAARRRVLGIEEKMKGRLRQAQRLEVELVAARPEGRRGAAPPPAPYTGREAMAAARGAALAAIDQDLEGIRRALREAKEALSAEIERDRAASSARQARSHELRKRATIRLRGQAGQSGPRTLVLEYMVPGARWSPAYTVMFDRAMAAATVSVRAAVAQRSGEDWRGVRLTLSTADAQRWTELPELHSLRIGRRQASPARKGWRAPPEGAAGLYADFDKFAGGAPPPAEPEPLHLEEDESLSLAEELAADDDGDGASAVDEGGARWPEPERAKRAAAPMSYAMAPPSSSRPQPASRGFGGAPPPAMAPMEMPPGAPLASKSMMARSRAAPPRGGAIGQGGSMMKERREEAPAMEAEEPGELLAYGDLRMPGVSASRRGELSRVSELERLRELAAKASPERLRAVSGAISAAMSAAGSAGRALPARYSAVATVGGFDYVYAAEGAVEVLADGEFHSIPLFSRAGGAELVYVAVPREGSEVFREVRLKNPIDAPLLAGPADIYVSGDYLMTCDLPLAPAGGELRLGLGVEQAVKVARNSRFSEESAGLMGGSLVLRHQIVVEVQNRLDRPISIELRERLPTLREGEDEIQIERGPIEPPWEAYEPEEYALRGGYRWSARLAPAGAQTFKASYAIKISAKRELVGGNRREG
ncbi:MAG: DUF4139 domain-containing protein [Nannocystis sp.]|nr:DUF4139 domain-containing protein [Nannocystis sp.]